MSTLGCTYGQNPYTETSCFAYFDENDVHVSVLGGGVSKLRTSRVRVRAGRETRVCDGGSAIILRFVW